jgi:uncharacterized membrane protein
MFLAWVFAFAAVMAAEVALSRGHPPYAAIMVSPLLAIGVGTLIGAVFWATSRRAPLKAWLLPLGSMLAFVAIVLAGGTSIRG